MRLADDLGKALDNDEFELVYQPIVDVTSGRIVGIESAIRWHHPERGLLHPDEFLPVAQASGLMVPIGEWVLYRSCLEVQTLDLSENEGLQLHVNVSPREFSDDGFASMVHSMLENADLPGERLTLELTESVFARDGAVSEAMLRELRAVGVRIAIDDFGSGNSSLASLRSMQVDELKIDRSFVAPMAESTETGALVKMILQLANDLDLSAVAMGVEDARQVSALAALGCRAMQGFYFSEPLSSAELQAQLSAPVDLRVAATGRA
jgi:EAL domain-containing protein (putative c-di-GMP-specific phosphodiesterase class I)